MLNPSTEEQEKILNLLLNHNVVIQAVAGSGKTTTALHITKKFRDKKILLLTFNKKLQEETELKAKGEGFKNLTVKTFHAFAGNVYNSLCKTTLDIKNNLTSSKKVNAIDYDIFIIDEAQDLNIIFYELLIKVFAHHQKEKDFKVIVLGDVYQSIYEFLESDSRFLSQAQQIFAAVNQYDWVDASLSTSFRVNQEVTQFINKIFYQKEIINSNLKMKNAIEYNVINQYELTQLKEKPLWFQHLKKLIDEYGVNETFILTNSPNSKGEKSLNRLLQNALSQEGIPVEVHDKKEEKLDLKQIENKLIFSSFHSSKGLERKLVIIFPFDASLFYRENNPNKIYQPLNELYVACTRSLEKLVLLHLYQSPPLPFLEREKLKTDYLNLDYLSPWDQEKFQETYLAEQYEFAEPESKFEVTNLLDWLKNDEIAYFYTFFDQLMIEPRKKNFAFKIGSYIKSKDKNGFEYLENVSSITGEAIVSKFEGEYFNSNSKAMTLLKLIKELNEEKAIKKSGTSFFNKYGWILSHTQEIHDFVETNDHSAKAILRIATIYDAVWEERRFKLKQIQRYDWITEQNYQEINEYLKTKLSLQIKFEKPIRVVISWKPNSSWKLAKIKQDCPPNYILKSDEKEIVGRIDALDFKNKTMWEFKFVNALSDEHYFQLLTYAYMNYANTKGIFKRWKLRKQKYKLMNIKHKEIVEIKPNWRRYKEFLYQLIDFKLTGNTILDNDEFIKRCLEITKNEG